jgi:hypothetical protein
MPFGVENPTHAIRMKDYIRITYNDSSQLERDKIVKYTLKEAELEMKKSKATVEEILEEAKGILLLVFQNPIALNEGNSQLERFHRNDLDLFSFLRFFKFNHDRRTLKEGTVNDFLNPSEKDYIDEKLQEAVYQGFLSPQVAVSQSSERDIPEKIKVTSFTLTIENSAECGKEFDDLENIRFLKKNVLSSEEQKEYKKIKEKYGLESLDDRFKKEVFGTEKNKYFILNTHSFVESSVVPNCEVAQKMLAGATIIQD